jgi:putative tryptophan/tyrosine transport system substrate-binding protein
MKRRQLLAAAGAGAIASVSSLVAFAQGRPVRIGLLASVPPTPEYLSALREGLRERGYVEGHNLIFDIRWPQGSFAQDQSVMIELIRANIDVIVAWGTQAVAAARSATSTIPIVMVSVSDPVGAGFVASLARPGGNVTGVTPINPDVSGKLVELLREILPGMKQVGVVFNPRNPGATVQMPGTADAARELGLKLQAVEARALEEYERAFALLTAQGVEGVVLLADPSLIEHRRRIAELARSAGLPSVFQRRESVDAGGLLAYGASNNDQFRQATSYVDRILKGTRPADLPVEQPTRFELVVNLKTAKALGLEVPPTLLARADEVIE